MKATLLRKKFIDFFINKNHRQIPSASLAPEDDPTILFTPAGMSPLVRYLMGEKHPLGKRLCSIQKCVRTDDIEEVGDLTHFTFFEMLGNWSLGDYFKEKAIAWSFEFLTGKEWLGLEPKNLCATVFKGDQDAPKDTDSIKIWQQAFNLKGIKAKEGNSNKPNFKTGERIFAYGKEKNWWGPAGQIGPCGPDTEIFYDTGKKHRPEFGKHCHPNCDCGRFFEIWNNVFMQYEKKFKGKEQTEPYFAALKQKNVDTGMGLERVVALTEYLAGNINKPDPFLTDLFWPIITQLEKIIGKKYQNNKRRFRIISDHLRAAVFIIADGIEPSNKDRGYILRRLIRRAIVNFQLMAKKSNNWLSKNWPYSLEPVLTIIIDIYQQEYPNLKTNNVLIKETIQREWDRFQQSLKNSAKAIGKIMLKPGKTVAAADVFYLFATFGIPFEVIKEIAVFQYKKNLDLAGAKKLFQQHQLKSKASFKQKFSGGLQDHSEKVIKLHTATHLLHAALRQILGSRIKQVGSNITNKRLRFDFTYPKKLEKEQIKQIEKLVNKKIKENLKINCRIMDLIAAKKQGALAFFGQKYPSKVKVYSIAGFSQEVCAGPHVSFTGSLGEFMIKKEESCGAGKRRIYAVLKNGN